MVDAFHKMFPHVAERELRTVRIQGQGEAGKVPVGEYLFVESYCTNPDCDCERVTISVAERRVGIIASISYDFDTSVSKTHAQSPNPCLVPEVRQSEYAEAALALFKEKILNEEYQDRLKQHYQLVKSAASYWSGRDEESATARRGDWASQRRKQQKAARRKNRR